MSKLQRLVFVIKNGITKKARQKRVHQEAKDTIRRKSKKPKSHLLKTGLAN